MKSSKFAHRMLRLAISDIAVLRACYMPFLQHRGLFVPSLQTRELGEKIFVVLRLEQQSLTVAGMASVCWTTPEFSNDGRDPGFGLHFDETAQELKVAIESALASDDGSLPQSVSYTL